MSLFSFSIVLKMTASQARYFKFAQYIMVIIVKDWILVLLIDRKADDL